MKGKYSNKVLQKICDMIKSDSFTVAEICAKVRVSERSYYNWQKNDAQFAAAIKKAEEERMNYFAVEAKKSLLKLIQGYTVQEKSVVMVESKQLDESGKPKPRIKEQKTIEKHYQPNTAAVIFALTNADPDNWTNRQTSELTGKGGKDLIPARVLSKQEMKEVLAELNDEY